MRNASGRHTPTYEASSALLDVLEPGHAREADYRPVATPSLFKIVGLFLIFVNFRVEWTRLLHLSPSVGLTSEEPINPVVFAVGVCYIFASCETPSRIAAYL